MSVLIVVRKNPLNHLRNLDTLEVIAEERYMFVAWCNGAKKYVDMTEIRFLCSIKFIL